MTTITALHPRTPATAPAGLDERASAAVVRFEER